MADMTEEDAFWAAIGEMPEDQLRRLVFADWCQENGREELAAALRATADRVPLADDQELPAGECGFYRKTYPYKAGGIHPESDIEPEVYDVMQGEIVLDAYRFYTTAELALRDLCHTHTLAKRNEVTEAKPA